MIAVPVKDKSDDPRLEERFGRSAVFCLIDGEGNRSFIDNDAPDSPSGAGVKTVQMLADRDVDIVIVPEVGPKATAAMEPLGIRVFSMGSAQNLNDLMALYGEGKLTERKNSGTPGGLRRA
jgi:predicted Fe-Mo cluster-binding NifX family protein